MAGGQVVGGEGQDAVDVLYSLLSGFLSFMYFPCIEIVFLSEGVFCNFFINLLFLVSYGLVIWFNSTSTWEVAVCR